APRRTRAEPAGRGDRRFRPRGPDADLGAVRLPGLELRPGLFPPFVGAREACDGRLPGGAVPDAEEVLGVSQEVPAAGVRVLESAVFAQWNEFDEFTATTMIAMIPPATPIHPSTMPAIASPLPVCRPLDRSISPLPS